MTRRAARAGFTILEVLVALAIFTMAAIVLGTAYVNVITAYQVSARGNELNQDIRFARAMLLAEPDRDKAEAGGQFDGDKGRRVTWKAAIEPTRTADLFTVAFECEISGADLKQNYRLRQSFSLLRPTWSKDGEREKLRTEVRHRILQMQPKGPS